MQNEHGSKKKEFVRRFTNSRGVNDKAYVVAGCCSVLQCAAVCCSVSLCVAVCCSVLQCSAVCGSVFHCATVCCSVLQCVAQNGAE